MNPSNKSILLVDDDINILTACAESLMLDGYQVDVAESGEKALEMLPKKKYHLIVTDLMMGEVDGMQLLRHAKEFSPFSEVIVLTAHGSVSTAVAALKMGAYDYLSKPFDPYRLDTAVNRALEHQTLLREVSGLKEILSLHEATRILCSAQDEKDILQALAECAGKITDADGTSVLTYLEDNKCIKVAATYGARHGVLQNQVLIAKPEVLEGMKIDQIKTLDSADLRQYLQMSQLPGFTDITHSLSAPVARQGKILAILNLSRTGPDKYPFSEEELRLVSILTTQFAFAIENARLSAQVKQPA